MEGIQYFGAALGLGLIVIGAGLGIGKLAAAAAEGGNLGLLRGQSTKVCIC